MEKHHVTILTNQGKLDLKCNELIQLNSWKFPTPKYAFMPSLRNLVNSGKLDDYDVIHIFEYPLFVADFLTFKQKSIKPPLILSFHSSLHMPTKFPLNIFKKIHHSVMLKFSDRITTFITSTQAEKIHAMKYGLEDNKIKVLPLGVKTSKISRNPSTKKFILYLGLLGISKNIDLLIRAYSLCKTDADLVIAGPDYGMRKNLEQLVKSLGLQKRVIFKGKVSEFEKEKLFSEATMFVFPAVGEIFSLTMIEAAAAGLPCMAFNVEANSEILEHMKSGILIDQIDAESLKNGIELLLENENLCSTISKNAILDIPRKYNWENTVTILERYYEKIISNKM